MELKKVKIADIIPYENNPRKNDEAVDAVAESIRQCGYCAPIVVDENMVILAGHTRLKALKKLGKDEAEVVIRDGLTEEQKKKYRLLDNKTNEFADWDFEKLQFEVADLDFGDFDFGFGDFGAGETDYDEYGDEDNPYTAKTDTPVYEPSGEDVSLSDCVNTEKYDALTDEIDASTLTKEQKAFLKKAAARHLVFSYNKIAEYYANSARQNL